MLISTGAGQFDIQSLVSFAAMRAGLSVCTPLLSTGHRPIQITPIGNVSSRIYKTRA